MSYYDDEEDTVSDNELEEARRRKLEELQRKAEEEERKRAEEAQRRAIIRVILTPEARSRLDNLRLVKPELVESIENQLITLAQSGRIKVPITDEELKKILEAVYNQTRREYRIRFR
ncbi:MAG: DNA-binding protein [Caldivirga sp.]|jgi:programmed cell death protein 5|nr:MAG: DNA-binding protein [Caldivirga sp. MG_3]KUO85933.1 MAG: DNA-binding protein [Caldivirga sp. CIS_19]KUO93076.1 MAG: DNA-binding protein [Caldivirga sp. JCHS_4]NAZ29160.1 DNA-binding protein [Caldivirga sp.]